ncbi:MAG: sodium-translocating pyrophosphatase [candidate division Zixibacteria bacterium]|nr:sodium-translocating pyrophosphatase [candidate division Zixibacteria bacterium]
MSEGFFRSEGFLLSLIIGISILGLVFAWWLASWVLKRPTGTAAMQAISNAIKDGAEAFLRRQNRTIVMLAALVALALFIGYGIIREHREFDPVDTAMSLALWVTVSFVFGAICSVIAGYVGMWVSIRTNIRTATAALTSLNDAMRTALRGGAVSGLLVVAMSLLGVTLLYLSVSFFTDVEPARIPLLIVGYGFGASFVALFAQVGGGIYTKAADVGADLVGKVEAGIPEDDPRNPAVIADLVGDNVGDCAGRGADLFESTAAENIGAMILGATLAVAAERAGVDFTAGIIGVMMFPLVARAFGIIASIVGILSVKLKNEQEDPMQALNRGYFVSAALAMIGFGATAYYLLDVPKVPDAWWHFFLCGIIGVVTSILYVFITQYYTEYQYRPVKEIADASTTGPATNIISGVAVGLESTALPVLVTSAALLGSYFIGQAAFAGTSVSGGLFGTAVATMGMLATAAYILAMDTFGPITDNAGGIVEMSHQPEQVRERTDRLDSVGNTTKALTKGYAVGSAGLAAFLLFQAYMDEILHYSGLYGTTDAAGKMVEFSVDLSKPVVFVGALLGCMLVFLFSSLCIRAVGKAAKSIIEEVRRQYAKLPRKNDMIQFPDDFKPDYGACVDIVTKAALREMVLPGLLVVIAPIAVGLSFKFFIDAENPLIAAESVAAFLMVGTIGGILMALFLNNSGGAWDNAKKYIETGAHGGKYITQKDGSKVKNPIHGAAVVGDTVGDPFKDTAGPSLHVLIKLLSTITLVLAPLFI